MDKAKLAKQFSAAARHYDEHAVVQRQVAERLLALARKMSPHPRRILELGCGTGLYTRLLGSAFVSAKIVAVDLSEQMVRVARTNVPGESVQFVVGDVERMDWGRYDLVSANGSLQWATDAPAMLMRLAGTLDEGGALACSLFGPETYGELDACMTEVLGAEARVTASRFASRQRLSAALAQTYHPWRIDEQRYTRTFDSLRELLLHIRRTGTRGQPEISQRRWTPGRLAEVERIYRQRYGSIRASYQVFYCRGWK